MGFVIRELKAFGAEVEGLDLSRPIEPDIQRKLYQAWLDYGVLVFRGKENDGDRQVCLARSFGQLQQHPVAHIRLAENPDLIFLGSEGDSLPVQFVNGQPLRGFLYWHSDMTYVPDINKGSLLRMVENPSNGGNTEWVDTAAAYDCLSPQMKARIEDLAAVHIARSSPVHAWGLPGTTIRVATAEEFAGPTLPQSFPPVLQPLVIQHQETCRRSLLLSPLSFVVIDNLPPDEGAALFEELMQHALKPEFRYKHEWSIGDMVLWDNRRTMHCATGYPPDDRRLVVRATLAEVQSTGRIYHSADVGGVVRE